ncbi:exodeoxyribonuclease-3 [Paenibacillus sp. DS2015]
MKLVSWNVNGLRACVTKGFNAYFEEMNADIFCVQEIKLQEGQIDMDQGEEYQQYWNYAHKKGYSGTAIFTRIKPLSVRYGMEEDEEPEGRMITLEFESFYLVNVYTPNAKRDLARLPYRLEWEDRFLSYLQQLDMHKPVIICGDLNVAHREIDLKNPKSNLTNSGFTPEERGKMTQLLDAGFIDTYRYFYPEQTDAYSW